VVFEQMFPGGGAGDGGGDGGGDGDGAPHSALTHASQAGPIGV
jgi:hypothetical protein